MIEIPISIAFLLVALASYGVMVSAVMLLVAGASFIQRSSMRKETGHLEQEIFLLRKQLKEFDSKKIVLTGDAVKLDQVVTSNSYWLR